jgi:hypothetical protein
VADDGPLEVRSYRTVFDLERRLYRIDRLRLNPGGVPVRGVVYAVVVSIAIQVIATLPVLAWLPHLLPWPARQLLLPAMVAAALTIVRVDGRPCHVALRSLVTLVLGPRRLVAWRRVARGSARWRPPDLVVIPDGSEPRARRARYRGPGAVGVAIAHELRPRHRRRVTLRPVADEPETPRKVVVIADGATLDVRHPRG